MKMIYKAYMTVCLKVMVKAMKLAPLRSDSTHPNQDHSIETK